MPESSEQPSKKPKERLKLLLILSVGFLVAGGAAFFVAKKFPDDLFSVQTVNPLEAIGVTLISGAAVLYVWFLIKATAVTAPWAKEKLITAAERVNTPKWLGFIGNTTFFYTPRILGYHFLAALAITFAIHLVLITVVNEKPIVQAWNRTGVYFFEDAERKLPSADIKFWDEHDTVSRIALQRVNSRQYLYFLQNLGPKSPVWYFQRQVLSGYAERAIVRAFQVSELQAESHGWSRERFMTEYARLEEPCVALDKQEALPQAECMAELEKAGAAWRADPEEPIIQLLTSPNGKILDEITFDRIEKHALVSEKNGLWISFWLTNSSAEFGSENKGHLYIDYKNRCMITKAFERGTSLPLAQILSIPVFLAYTFLLYVVLLIPVFYFRKREQPAPATESPPASQPVQEQPTKE